MRADEWIGESAQPAEPLAEFFARYVASHGPAGARDFAWWSGLPLGVARTAARRLPELFTPDAVTDAEISDARERYRAFITG